MTPAAGSAAGQETAVGSGPARHGWRRLERRVLEDRSPVVARALLGRLIVSDRAAGRCVGRIVETEAYDGPADRASHARAGRTSRTAVMFGPPGHAYVYLVYGIHDCLNVVCGPDGVASAVLIRALEPIEGLELMRARRGPTGGPDARLAAGPARLTKALGIDRADGGTDLVDGDRLYLAEPLDRPAGAAIAVGPRIGVDYAGPGWADRPWRFGSAGHPSLSRPFPPVG